jgi:hypothetical protein
MLIRSFAMVRKDVQATDWFAGSTVVLLQAGFSGVPTADGSLTCIQLAKMLAITLGIQPSTKNTCAFTDCFSVSSEENALLLALKAAGIFKGFEDGSFRPTDTLTLAQVAVLIDRVLAAK